MKLLISQFIIGLFILCVVNAAEPIQLSPGETGLPPLELSIPDTISIDTLASESDAGLDTIITYSADQINFTFDPRVTILSGDAKVHYQTMSLDAENIRIYWDKHLLEAEGGLDTFRVTVPWTPSEIDSLTALIDISLIDISLTDSSLTDSVIIDTTGNDLLLIAMPKPIFPPLKRDSVAMVGFPELDDGNQIINGTQLSYDMKTRRGKVIEGVTDMMDGHYYGEQIKKVDDKVYNIRSGYFTSCELEEPHYRFWSRDMKLIMKDRAISRPVVLYFDRTPVMILPYGVFPTKGGRHSGVIIPRYGESGSQGRYFNNLGYYWAPNDYLDVRTSMDYYERFGFLFRGDFGYTKRYKYNGGVSGSMTNKQFGDRVDRSWDVKLNHKHTLSPTMSLNANGYYVSDDKYIKNVSQNQLERLNRIIRSNATLNKRWADTPYSATINASYTKYLDTGAIDQSFPKVAFTRSRSQMIPAPEHTDKDDLKWWNKFYYRYGNTGEIRKKVRVITEISSSIIDDSLTTIEEEIEISRSRAGIQHNLGLTFTPDPIYYLAITPSVSYKETWVDEWNEYFEREDGVIDTVKHNGLPEGFRARRTFNARIGLSTRLYGLFTPKMFGLEAIRHTLSPSVNLTYVPDFSESKWNYYDIFYDDITGKKIYRDHFAGNIYGATPKTESRSVGIGVGNLFEYKVNRDGVESKGQLFTLNTGTSFNFAADSLKWANLSSSVRIPALKGGKGNGFLSQISGGNLNFRATHSFYSLNKTTNKAINKSASGGLRLLNYDLSTSFSIESSKGGSKRDTTQSTTTLSEDRFNNTMWQPSNLPWKAGFTFRYSESHTNPENITKSIWGSANLEMSVTQNWKISYSSRVDLHNRKVVSTNISLHRDLHCWEGKFVWNPTGLSKGYYLIINIKSSQLKDVKIEKREGGGGFLGL